MTFYGRVQAASSGALFHEWSDDERPLCIEENPYLNQWLPPKPHNRYQRPPANPKKMCTRCRKARP